MMFLPHNDNHQGFDDGPSSPVGRKATSALNQESYSTPKSKYKSVEKHAHELINTPKPSSKKKSMFSLLENTSDLPSFDDDVSTHIQPLSVHRQLSTIQENFDDDKENNQNYMNQYNRHFGAPEKHVKKLNLADQGFQNDQMNSLESQFEFQINNVFQSIKANEFNNNINASPSNMIHNMYQQNKLIDFFQMFNMKNEQIQNLFDMSAQFEIINSGLSSSVTENIMQLNQTFNFLQVDLNTIEVVQQEDVFIINLRGIGFGYTINPMNLVASAKINYSNNLISHIRIQFL